MAFWIVSVTYVKYCDCSVGFHQSGCWPCAPPLPFSKSLIHGAGLPPQPACQKIGMSWMPAALALASSVSHSVKLNVPAAGSIVPHGMLSSAVVRPSAASPAKNDSDQAVPLLSKSSWVDHIGVVGDELACAIGVRKPPRSASSTARTANGASRDRNPPRRNADAYLFTLMSRSSSSDPVADVTVTRATLACNISIYSPQIFASSSNYWMGGAVAAARPRLHRSSLPADVSG